MNEPLGVICREKDAEAALVVQRLFNYFIEYLDILSSEEPDPLKFSEYLTGKGITVKEVGKIIKDESGKYMLTHWNLE